MLVARGSSLRRHRRRKGLEAPPPIVDELVAAGTQARLYYVELRPDHKEPKPTKILSHHDAGPKKGRQYEAMKGSGSILDVGLERRSG